MTCKDCIHENVCSALIKDGLPWEDGKYPVEAFCLAFRNKADVVEVRHGEWILKDSNGNGICSVCNRLDRIDSLATHCRYCGAKIDGERKANDGT